jgi:hypothetical protein
MKDRPNKELMVYGQLLDIFNLYIMGDYLNFKTMVMNTKNYQGSIIICCNPP